MGKKRVWIGKIILLFLLMGGVFSWGIEVEGRVLTLIIDGKNGKSEKVQYLKTSSGKIYKIANRNDIGDKYVVIDGNVGANTKVVGGVREIYVTTYRKASPKNSLMVSEPNQVVGEQRMLVALFNYPDDKTQPFTLDDIKNYVENDSDSVNEFFKENSYNKVYFTVDYLDWATLPRKSTDYKGDENLLLQDSIKTIDSKVNFRNYNRLCFIYNVVKDVWWAGLGSIGTWSISTGDGTVEASIDWINGVYLNPEKYGTTDGKTIIAHELGHNFGFWHASSIQCALTTGYVPENLNFPDKSCSSYNEYGDANDIMGNSYNYENFSSIWKNSVGWLTDVVTALQDGSYTLYFVEQTQHTPRALRVPIGRDNRGNTYYYWIEYRTNDSSISKFDRTKGVQVRAYFPPFYIDSSSKTNSLRFVKDDTGTFYDVTTDQPFIDKYRGIKISLNNEVDDGVNSYVTLGVEVPKLIVDPIFTDYGTISGSEEESITITNKDTSPVTIKSLNMKGDTPSEFYISSDGCTGKTLGYGQSCQIKVMTNPTSTGRKNAYLTISTNSPITPLLTAGFTAYYNGTTSSGGGGDGRCFIATAAYGSYLEPHVMTLRNFRDRFLLTNPLGREFVKLYYRYSPPIAQYIRDKEGLKIVVRALLTPLVLFIEHPLSGLLLLLGLVGGVVAFRRKRGIAS
ncbi:MAG: hypothetical protein C6I01_05365 [Epsilonproteobacteria bacterium]|nr:hypothetical protein [Campylobacterota bacterium]NPA88814.1 choice-of-anchor D domain-containing protein [Campylobacterota bacterium]